VSLGDGLLDILIDALSRSGSVTGRRMFGGIGVYFNGIFFAIIDDGMLYFRVSETTRAEFEAEGSSPFTYATKKGPAQLGSYWRLPERWLDDPEDLRGWAEWAIAAARDVSATKERKRRAPTTKADARRIHSKPAKR
jgi:DNA transformation protein